MTKYLVAISGRIILRTNNKTSTLLSTSVDRFNNVDQLLLVFQHPVQLVIISRTKIAHHVLVAEEEHKRDGIVEFVHLVEVGDLVEVADVDDSEVLHTISDTIENFILPHAVRIPVTAKAYDYQAFFFGKDGLVNVPTSDEMGEDD